MVLTALLVINGEMPLPVRSQLSDWTYKGGILSYKDWVYVPEQLQLCHAAVQKQHDHPSASHPGVLKIRQLVTTEFWWPRLATFICKYVNGCATCQQNKANTHPTPPPLIPIPSTASCLFQQVSCDLITNLPISLGSTQSWSW